jgi:hypothetical protein
MQNTIYCIFCGKAIECARRHSFDNVAHLLIFDGSLDSGVEPGDLAMTSRRATNFSHPSSKHIIIFTIYIYLGTVYVVLYT